jgi:epoxide hydrolase
LTNTAASSARFYYENAHAQNGPTGPLGLANFADNFQAIRPCAERDHANIVSWNFYDRGNHFATQTAPDLLINDIRTFFQRLRAEEESRP